eukprot:583140-Pyramimonas_sp.AAC.1
MKPSTASLCLPSRAGQAGPGSAGGLGGDPRCWVTFVMLGPHCPPLLAAWFRRRRGSTDGPNRSAREAPYRRRWQVGSWSGLMSLGFSAPAFLPIHASRSTDGPSTASRSAGLRSAACHACAMRQATNLAPRQPRGHFRWGRGRWRPACSNLAGAC